MTPHTTHSWVDTVPTAPPVDDWYLAPCAKIEKGENEYGPFMKLYLANSGDTIFVKPQYWDFLEPYSRQLATGAQTMVPVFDGDNGKVQFSVKGAAAGRKAAADDDTKYFVSAPTQLETLKLKPTIAYAPLITRITQDAKLRCLSTTQLVNQILRDHYGIR